MTSALWTPSKQQVKNSNMTAFMEYINMRYQTTFCDYQAFHRWSVNEKALFWAALWDYFEVKSQGEVHPVVTDEKSILNAKWFPEATLNFTENLLRRKDAHPALVALKENGERRELSYQALHQSVAKLQQALKAEGVKKGTRVAALMPNTIETIIAMLATASLGAIWSSCSPDFGFQGVMDRFKQIEPDILFTVDGYQYNGKDIDIRQNVLAISHDITSIRKVIITPFLSKEPDISAHKKAVFYEDFLIEAEEIQYEALSFSSPLYIMYSSGTTGVPKCIVHGVGGTLLQHLKELALHSNLSEKDTLFYFTTCGWMMWNWFVSALALGSTLVLYDGSPGFPDMSRLLDIIQKEKVTAFGTSAKYISSLQNEGLKPNESHDVSSLKTIFSTGSPLSPKSFDYVYQHIKADLQLSSISGGTDILSCFALGNPNLPVYRGELQCIGLGMDVAILNEAGMQITNEKGELVCLSTFPSQPVCFWSDKDNIKYKQAYFSRFDDIWAHGDYAKITPHFGMVIYGRSDAILNPGGVRIGTAEIYRQVEKVNEVTDSVVVGQPYHDDVRVILFVVLQKGKSLTDELLNKIKRTIRQHATPRHVPSIILSVPDIPRTISGKTAELAVKKAILGEVISNEDALKNPESLNVFKALHPIE
jgi:acetoacetyl-CoA synthetase